MGYARAGRQSGWLKKHLQIAILLCVSMTAVLVAVAGWHWTRFLIHYFGKSTRYDAMILEAGRRNGVDPRLLKAVIWQESRFRLNERGSRGEIGLMQLMPRFAVRDWAASKQLPIPDNGVLVDPTLNIEIGSWYLGRAMRRWDAYEDAVSLALSEYNAGITRADAWKPTESNAMIRNRIDIRSTRDYIDAISERFDYYKHHWDVDQEN